MSFVAHRSFAALIALLLGLLVAPAAYAQGSVDWRERRTDQFTILYNAGGEAEAERYAAFVDTVYEEIALAFAHRTATPLTLRLYPNSEEYYQINPAARNVPGVVAHADFRRRELVVIVERTLQQSEEEVRNNVRHELTHIVVSDLSAGRLNTGFHEGIAQYMERPAPELERKITILRSAVDQDRLLRWSDLDSRDTIYGDPALAYPQALSIVAFLVERYGFAEFQRFLEITARSSGYRSALERTYNDSPADLEAEWRNWLPSYLAGGYRSNVLERYDPRPAASLIGQGRYAEAQADLERGLAVAQQNPSLYQSAELATIENLLQRAQDGLRAERLAEDARTALLGGDYERAAERIGQARMAFAALEDTRQSAVLAEYEDRVGRGLRAIAMLESAGDLAAGFRFPQARAAADSAMSEFTALNDQLRADNALALRNQLDFRQRLAGLALLAIGLGGAALSLIGQLFQRPTEAW
ncbi:MAG: hypothetical protein HC822_07175 [Oscillochloris sp.]|nr:hypothetical protein [Oscillochloris sp.]